jgi:hypothetical protein
LASHGFHWVLRQNARKVTEKVAVAVSAAVEGGITPPEPKVDKIARRSKFILAGEDAWRYSVSPAQDGEHVL